MRFKCIYFFCWNNIDLKCWSNIDLKYTSSSVIQLVEVYLKYTWSICEVCFKYTWSTLQIYFGSIFTFSIFEVYLKYILYFSKGEQITDFLPNLEAKSKPLLDDLVFVSMRFWYMCKSFCKHGKVLLLKQLSMKAQASILLISQNFKIL